MEVPMFKFILPFMMITSLYANIEDPAFQGQGHPNMLAEKGGWSSGGGNAIVCFQDDIAETAIKEIKLAKGIIPNRLLSSQTAIESIEMYDLFESKLPRGLDPNNKIKIIQIQDDQDLIRYSHGLMIRFAKMVPIVSRVIGKGLSQLPEANMRFHQGAVKQQNDIGEINHINDKKCIISTIAIQRNWNNFFELHIDARLFNHPKHSRLSKAVLLLHEFIYSTGRKKGHLDSSQTRKLVETSISVHRGNTIGHAANLVEELGFNPNPNSLPEEGYIFNTYVFSFPFNSFNSFSRYERDFVKFYRTEKVEVLIDKIKTLLAKYNQDDIHFEGLFLDDIRNWLNGKTPADISEAEYNELEALTQAIEAERTDELSSRLEERYEMSIEEIHNASAIQMNKGLAHSMLKRIKESYISDSLSYIINPSTGKWETRFVYNFGVERQKYSYLQRLSLMKFYRLNEIILSFPTQIPE
jgi:hypothetical protein